MDVEHPPKLPKGRKEKLQIVEKQKKEEKG
jgi:hypothetical protein